MANDSKKRVVSFDLDGTLAEEKDFPTIGKPIKKVIKLLEMEQKNGSYTILFTTRLNPDEAFDTEIEAERINTWLKENRIRVDQMTALKPMADLYVDNRAYNPFTKEII